MVSLHLILSWSASHLPPLLIARASAATGKGNPDFAAAARSQNSQSGDKSPALRYPKAQPNTHRLKSRLPIHIEPILFICI